MMKLVQTKQPVRLQMAVFNQLVAEVIVENLAEADRIWAKWSVGRYKRNQPMGCAAMYSADNTRMWNVPVGSMIP